ncbi:anti-sigma factor family protein [Saccharothrix coeruleofusca]|uniref:Putative zinc-finger domain-containing protein n=1 Tax=Saccharothrix coeruleofusca TaxID=33919 RepID=A0A918AJC0_9PSEU|nr:zf-HC2 domain-containing protein [Saccharothrix coeruleofusca]GGP47526.1 hypothetical protein GCM10010185_19230 [Saccharothrix coeruleofusca]
MSCSHALELGAYLLGSLDPAERSHFERHLRACAPCRREMLRLAPLPGLLSQVRLTDLELPFEDPQPSPDLLPLPPRQVVEPAPPPPPAAPRRRWPLLVGAGALVVVLLAAVLVAPRLLERSGDPAPAAGTAATWTATDAASGVAASAELVGRSWGTELRVSTRGMPKGARCKLVVHDRAGRTEIGGWWGTDHPEDARIPGSTSFAYPDIERLDVVVDMKVLVSVKP